MSQYQLTRAIALQEMRMRTDKSALRDRSQLSQPLTLKQNRDCLAN
ncbi:hypothetical protein NDI49_09620 [Trichocoleus sp. ST-U3]|nr:hypothetical protein [Coleofasciculus sp. FACHB-542]MBD2085326.1 hypothetical protein [Coleofasciculus sp. FACHB-542]